MNLEADFERAAEEVLKLNQKPANAEMLKLYGMFKYIKNGNCKAITPSRLYIREHAKVTEWMKHNDRNKDEVMQEYIEFTNELILKYWY